jgi:hypothetical protein
MRSGAAPVAGADITTAWQKVTAFSEALPTFDMAFDFANDTFSFERPGLYQTILSLSIEHNNSGSARELDVRVRNLVTGGTTRGIRVPTGSGDRTTTYTQTLQPLIEDATLGQAHIVEVSAPIGNYSSVQWRGASIQAARLNYAF